MVAFDRVPVNAKRRNGIADQVRLQGFVSVDALARQFQVTPQTIRSDINELSEQGILERFHGGARVASSTENLAYPERQGLYSEEKRQIAQLVARHVPNNSSLFINIGTTNEAVAEALLGHKGLSVVTNNLNVASILSRNNDCRVIIAGGQVRHHDRGIVGEATLDLIRQFKMDSGIIGISGIDVDGSLLDFDYREVRVAQAIMESSRRTFLVADHSKFGRNAMVRLGNMADVDAFFTDRALPQTIAECLSNSDTAVHIADQELHATAANEMKRD